MKRNEAIIFALSRSKEADTSNNIIPSLIPSEKIIHKFYITIIRTINSQNNQPVFMIYRLILFEVYPKKI
ncbi:hypothetical protein RclHR1_09280006 [Rhizophagus clarus]|uniref:Uncharacterized protein n=1 Tax=Rhizophagus clarus TaxID=94130 RepID=A0A2Z6SE78_9GLOM|nr:hypothetical protein RclHR1_09280006 [Rhizophagus clarus]